MNDLLTNPIVMVALKSTTILVLGAAALLATRRASASLRHVLIGLTFVSLVLLPSFSAVIPGYSIGLPAKEHIVRAGAEYSPLSSSRVVVLDESRQGAFPAKTALRTAESPTRAVSYDVAPTLQLLWLIGVLLAGVRIVGGMMRARGLLARSQRCFDAGLRERLVSAEMDLGLRAKARLRIAPNTDVLPMTWGFLRPIVMVPHGFEKWPAEQQDATIRHEFGHIKRWDWVWLMLSNVACAVYWFNPFVWTMSRRMRYEAELACDDLVLAQGVAPSTYATQLLEVLKTMKNTTRGMKTALQMAGESQFETRLKAVLAQNRSRAGVASWGVLALASLFGAILAPIAALQLHDAPVAPKPTPPKVEKSQEVVVMRKVGEPTIVVTVTKDGQITKNQKSLTKRQIAEAKNQVKKEMENIRVQIKVLKNGKSPDQDQSIDLKAMERAQKALEQALKHLDSKGGSKSFVLPDSSGAFTVEIEKKVAEAQKDAMFELERALAEHAIELSEIKGLDLKALQELHGKKGLVDMESLKALEGLKFSIPKMVLPQVDMGLGQALKEIEGAFKRGEMTKSEYDAARSGIEKARKSLQKRSGTRTLNFGEPEVSVRVAKPRISSLTPLSPSGATRSSTAVGDPDPVKAMIRRSEERMRQRQLRSGADVKVSGA